MMDILVSDKLYSICKLSPTLRPSDVFNMTSTLFFFFRTPRETSLIIESQYVPDALNTEDDWMQFSIINSIPFNVSGVLASIIQPFTKVNISILAVSTFDTDYVFFKKHFLKKVISILKKNNSIERVYEPETTGVL